MSEAVSTALDSAQSGYDQAVNAAIEKGETMIPENGLIALIGKCSRSLTVRDVAASRGRDAHGVFLVTTALVAIAAGLAIWQWTKRRNGIIAITNKEGDKG
jgi:hypothetical protein